MGDVAGPEIPWEQLVAIASLPVSVIDSSGRQVAYNEAYAEFLGRPSNELAGLEVADITRPSDLAWTRRYLARLTTGEIERFESDKIYVRRDGREVRGRLSARALRDDDGVCRYLIATILPMPDEVVTPPPGVADRLLEFGGETISLVAADGTVIATRGAQTPANGYPTSYWRGRNISEVLRPDEWELLTAPPEWPARGPRANELETTMADASGAERTISMRALDCRSDPILNGFVVVARDVTDQRAFVDELAARRATAEAAVDAQARLLATVSHELRNPLHALCGMAELLAAEELGPSAVRLADAIVRQLQGLTRVTEDLLHAAQLEAGEAAIRAVPTRLESLIADVVELGSAAVGSKPVSVTGRIEPGVPEWVMVDADRLRQILANLVGNAAKFTEQGEIGLIVQPAVPPDVTISVVDTGVGIPEGEQQRVFEPFVVGSTAGSQRGTGLGLAIAGRLVDAMEGCVTISSEVDRGTRVDVTVSLPGCRAPATAELLLPPPGLRVLVIEDDPVNQELARTQLERLGLVAEVVGTGEDGLDRLCRAARDPIDVVLMDVQLPGWSGTETTERIRACSGDVASVPVIGVSASASAADRQAFMAAGMDDFVAKPATLAEISNAIRRAAGATEGSGRSMVPAPLDEARLDQLAVELGDRIAVERIVTTFLRELPQRVEEISTPDEPAARRAAHTLAAAAELVGAVRLAALGRSLESTSGTASAAELKGVAAETQEALERWLDG